MPDDMTAVFAAWLVKKAREERARGPRFVREADAIGQLASQVSRGAVRPNNLRALPPGEESAPEDAPALRAENERLRDRIAELETFASGCDGEGCVLPHSSWCVRARKTATENSGCTCGQSQHAGHCWLVSPPQPEVERLRAELAARPTRAEVLREAADKLSMDWGGPEHDDGMEEARGQLRRMADAAEQGDDRARVATAATGTGHPAHPAPCRVPASADCTCPPAEPTRLRWGLDDVEYGDDDSVTVLLSGPRGTPFVLELDPDRATALRDALTGPEDDEPCAAEAGESDG